MKYSCGHWNRIKVNKIFLEQPSPEPKVKVMIPMYEPLETSKCEKCGKVIVESKELTKHRGINVVESFDFSLGLIFGVIITFIGNYLTEKWRESKEKKSIARALVTELEWIKEAFSKHHYDIKTPIFSTNIPKLALFKGQTIDAVLRTYHEVDLGIVSHLKITDLKKLTDQIDYTIAIIEKERDC